MSYVVVAAVALLASLLSLFSGFGLSTVLMPVYALFFPVPLAIALTAVIHLLNNLFKLFLIGRHAELSLVWRFGLPAIGGAWGGAWILSHMSARPPLATFTCWGAPHTVGLTKIVVALLIVAFALPELLPRMPRVSIDQTSVALGGFLSGLFGGLSGHQGALRSAVLMNCGLSKEAFIATGVVVACLVDVTRLVVYWERFASVGVASHRAVLVVSTLSAFLRAWMGARLVPQVTMRKMQVLVGILLLLMAVGIGSGML